MSGTNKNPYPICYKCGVEISPQDRRGWEKIVPREDHPVEIWLCPNCIGQFQHTQDIRRMETNTNYRLQNRHSDYRAIIQEIVNRLLELNKEASDAIATKKDTLALVKIGELGKLIKQLTENVFTKK